MIGMSNAWMVVHRWTEYISIDHKKHEGRPESFKFGPEYTLTASGHARNARGFQTLFIIRARRRGSGGC